LGGAVLKVVQVLQAGHCDRENCSGLLESLSVLVSHEGHLFLDAALTTFLNRVTIEE